MRRGLVGAVVLILAGCGGGGAGTSTPAPTSFAVQVVADDLSIIWDIQPLPDGRMLVLERNGKIRVYSGGVLDPQPYITLPVAAEGQGGLLDLEPDPNYGATSHVFVSSTHNDGAGMYLRITRYFDSGGTLLSPVTIWENNPVNTTKHFGGRMAIGPDGKLYVSTGDRGTDANGQDLTNLNGKILRLNLDGTVPSDNPFVGTAGVRPEIYAYGNRNPQGLFFQPGTGRLYEVEHGPDGGDEVNLIVPGANYGWPNTTHGETAAGVNAPLAWFSPSTAPGSVTVYTGSAFPGWQGNLFVANLAGQRLQRFPILSNGTLGVVENLLTNQGRLRAVATGPDGNLYVGTSNGSDRLLRLVPVP